MKKFLNTIAVILLIFNGTGALFGGGSLMSYPDGSNLGLSLDLLKQTPFDNYLIPGIVLFIANGLFSLLVLLTIFLGLKSSAWFIIFQGSILTGWILIQVLLIKTLHPFHFLLGSVGIALFLIGCLSLKYKN